MNGKRRQRESMKLNNSQRILLAIYLPITVLILIFDHLYPKEDMIQYLRYAIMITLFLSVLSMKKRFHEQKIMALSFLFLVISDFFLVYSTTLEQLKISLAPFGIAGFLFAYLCLIAAYQKNFRLGKAELVTAIPVVFIFISVWICLKPYVKGPLFIGTIIFGIVLCYMCWTAICTLYRGYYSKKIARIIAVSGILMFICDIGVAFTLFHPYYSEVYVPWLKNIIWGAYIPGWTFLAVIIGEDCLLESASNK